MNKCFIFTLIASVLVMTTTAAPTELKPPSAEEVTLIEKAAPAKATAKPQRPRKVLIVNQCEGYPHSAVPYGSKAFEIMGRKTGAYTTVVVDDLSILERPEFDTFDAIIMNNTTLKVPLLAGDDEAREAQARKRFIDFIRNGKGLVGVHAATDCLYKWPEYGEIIGGYFDGHPWNENVRVKLDDPGHPLLAAFKGLDFTVADEIYQFRNYSRDSLRVLMSLDATKTDMTKDSIKREDKDFAVAWIHEYGKGRVFYFSLGHRHEIFWTPAILQCTLDGIQYALGDLPADATPSSKLKKSYLEKSRTAAFALGLENMLAELATYTLDGDTSIAKQMDEFVDNHLNDSRSNTESLSQGLAQVATNPQASLDGRALACRKLSMVGTDNAVAALEALIADQEMGNWARYALARMPGKTVDQALVKALDQTKGDDRIAIAAMVGNRRINSAVPSLSKIAASSDTAAAEAAVEALGQIGDKAAIKELIELQGKLKGAPRLTTDRALLNCADSERINGSSSAAKKIYALLLSNESAEYIRGCAFYGINLSEVTKGAVASVAALKSSNTELAFASARVIRDMPDKCIVEAAASALSEMQQTNLLIALAALADRGDRSAQTGVLKLVASENAEIRIAALQALERLGDKQAVKNVMKVITTPEIDRDSLKAARKTLASMTGPDVNKEIVTEMRTASVQTKAEYVSILGARKARETMSELLAAARDSDAFLAEEARKAISLMAQAQDLPVIVALLIDTTDVKGQQYLENVIVKAAKTTDNDALKNASIQKALNGEIPVNARCSLLLALGRVESASSLPALLSAAKDSNPVIRRAALKSIAENWPDAAPLQALRDASRNDLDEQCRVLALSGYARMLTMPSDRPVKETLKLYGEALALVKGSKEKSALLIGLGSLVHPEALAFVTPYLKDSSVSAEAFKAAISIREGMNGNAMVLTSCVNSNERNALDNNPKTRWTTGAAMRGGEWFMVDLGYEDYIKTVMLDAGPEGSDQPRGYELYVSLDGENWGKPVAKGGDPKQRAFTITCDSVYGRFIKIVQMGTNGGFWSINEIRINGVPDYRSYPPLDRAGWTASAFNAPGGNKPESAIDNDLTTRWGSGGAMKSGDWFAVDMSKEHIVYSVVMNAANSGGDYPRGYQIFTSMDGKEWYGPVGMGEGKGALTTATVLPTKARHVKIVQTGTTDNNWWSIYDLQILGE